MTAKYSNNSRIKDILMHPLTAAVAPAALALGASAIHGAVQRYQEGKEKAQAYSSMLALHPALKQRPETQVKQLFNSLSRVNPTMGNDPLVAGAWVDNILENNSSLGGSASNQALLVAVKDLAQIRSHITGAREKERNMRPDIGGFIGTSAKSVITGYQESVRGDQLAAVNRGVEALKSREDALAQREQRYGDTVRKRQVDNLRSLFEEARKSHPESAVQNALNAAG
jgi:hypothetical protein